MNANGHDLLRTVDCATLGEAAHPSPRPLFDRLQWLAALLRDAPPAEGGRPRFLWRGVAGAVRVLPMLPSVTIGRDPACDLVLTASRLSRRHACVEPTVGGYLIRDLNSANGTMVNGAKVRRQGRLLNDGDQISVGGEAIAFLME